LAARLELLLEKVARDIDAVADQHLGRGKAGGAGAISDRNRRRRSYR
jgi:hypothetical protein